jgi:class 3 adenylate cyclase/CHASE2 domain-containing sensor protein
LLRLTSDYSRHQKILSLGLGLAVAFLVCGVSYLVQERTWIRFMENLIQRTWMDRTFETYGASGRYVHSGAAFMDPVFAEKLVLVVFDDSSLAAGLEWPIRRGLYLDLVQRLEKAGARTIALDILFGARGPDPQQDELLRQALARPSVVVPYVLAAHGDQMVRSGIYEGLLDDWTEHDYATRFGFTKELTDPDLRVRYAVLEVLPIPSQPGPSNYALDIVALAHFEGISPAEVMERCRERLFNVDLSLPGSPYLFTARTGRIAFFGSDVSTTTSTMEPPDSHYQEGQIQVLPDQQARVARVDVPSISDFIQVYSIQDILNVPEDQLEGLFGHTVDPVTGKETPNQVIAMVGVTILGGHDVKGSEVGAISGVGIHANVMWNLIQGNFLHEPTFAQGLALVFGLAALATLVGVFLDVRVAGLVFLGILAGYWWMGYRLMYDGYWTTGGTKLPVFLPWLGALASFGSVTLYNVRAQKVARDRFARILQEVAPIPDLEALLGRDGLKVGSEERVLTILFSDIRGYTDLSEGLSPVTVTEMLNTYHSAMGEVFERHGGIVFDYQGDAQMVVFGLVPESQPNHAAAACRAAAGMVLRLEELGATWKAQGRPVFETGIGICTGPVAIGVLGSAQRKQYAAIGDATNTAARMQGKSKELGSPILITQSTFEAAGEEIVATYLESVRVKGKKEPLQVYGVDARGMAELTRGRV